MQAITDAMVDAYLRANDAYWREVDALPSDPTKPWRQGTPREATRVSLAAALDAAQAEPVALQLLREELPHAEWEDKHIHPVGSESFQNWRISIRLPVPLSEPDKSPEAALLRLLRMREGK